MTDLEQLQPVANQVIDRWATEGFSGLTPTEQVFLLVWGYGGEVNNGGHVQFFSNTLGEYADETVCALTVLGCDDFASLLKRCIAAFPDGVSRDLSERNETLENLPASVGVEFEIVDKEFYKLDADQFLLRRLKLFLRAEWGA